jgi:1,2-diacylglycerol-3-alpha-glucose alpha-1,2-glucosyltransferase
MSIINYITDESTVNKLTKNKAWLETYIPEMKKRLESMGYNIVFDRKNNFDLMHIHLPLALAYRLIRYNNTHYNYPIVYHGHATEDSFSVGNGTKYLVRKWLKKVASRSDLIICPSRSAGEYYRRLLPDHAIIQLNYGINLDKYSYSDEGRTRFRKKYDISNDEIVVSCVGGISARKGIEDFINISKRHPDIKFMWVGQEYTQHPSIDLFYKLFARHGNVKIKNIPNNIFLTGYIKDVPDALSASDIFFFPSKQETQGLALIEAAACSCPIVTRNLPVFKEWLTHGRNCLIGSCEKEFESYIKYLIDDDALKKRLGSEALRSAKKHHDISKTSLRLGDIYQELMT